ncbi:MAG: hypothetical protein RBR69_03955 [Candidatus Cloacimonadaceae bacterium]|jgi:hypothetical protein|nr:hypothetical protein [Candidatus Cloacimonadota bacterium]MDY0127266.1 hypothetical protein [Candidatus Cloacimonadaceae bacterium]MCB5255875.1 hypothetical protein [Candidatus Cloacimonadota bacterium]MCK9177802.1 hypothetical protein [Candidatus Cloacimonadota bacterium]MCK9241956.1 hypothetical protein [Candidatus Cloacimonadota bacterium]
MSENKKSWKKYLVVAGLIVIIVALILIIPRCNRYQNERRAEEVFKALTELHIYVDNYVKNNNSASGFDLEKAFIELGFKDSVLRNWEFAIAWKPAVIYTSQMMEKLKDVELNEYVNVAPYKIIMAVATASNPVGEGRKLWFDGDNNSYHGFGADDSIEPDWHRIFPKP